LDTVVSYEDGKIAPTLPTNKTEHNVGVAHEVVADIVTLLLDWIRILKLFLDQAHS
jgi:hypothetical protein